VALIRPELLWLDAICKIPHDKPRAGYMCILTAYMDESGIHDKDWCVVAGFLGNDEQWSACMNKWRGGLGKRKGLHMKTLRWNDTERVKKLLERLGPIPDSCGLKRIWGGVRFQDYEDMLPDFWKGNLEVGAYMLAFGICFSRTMARVPLGQRVAFVSSKQTKYSQLVALPKSYLNKVANGDFTFSYLNESTMLTEPADYLAFEIRQTKIDIDSKKSKLGRSILGDGKGYGAVVPRDEQRRMVQESLKVLREIGAL
jgi:hypothetical protein